MRGSPYVNSYNNEKPLNQYFYRIQRLTMGLVTLAMQHIPLSYAEPEEFTEEELASFKKSVEDSHKRFGMEAPKWKTA